MNIYGYKLKKHELKKQLNKGIQNLGPRKINQIQRRIKFCDFKIESMKRLRIKKK